MQSGRPACYGEHHPASCAWSTRHTTARPQHGTKPCDCACCPAPSLTLLPPAASTSTAQTVANKGEPKRSGLDPDPRAMAIWLARLGFALRDMPTHADLQERLYPPRVRGWVGCATMPLARQYSVLHVASM